MGAIPVCPRIMPRRIFAKNAKGWATRPSQRTRKAGPPVLRNGRERLGHPSNHISRLVVSAKGIILRLALIFFVTELTTSNLFRSHSA